MVNFLVWLDLYLTSFCQSSTICLLVSNLPFLSKLFKSSRSLSGIQLCGPQHPTLIQCLETLFGLKDLELAWLCIFLTYRTQSVCIDNIMSNPCQVFSSLPQGSVCGHLLLCRLWQTLSISWNLLTLNHTSTWMKAKFILICLQTLLGFGSKLLIAFQISNHG